MYHNIYGFYKINLIFERNDNRFYVCIIFYFFIEFTSFTNIYILVYIQWRLLAWTTGRSHSLFKIKGKIVILFLIVRIIQLFIQKYY